MSTTTKTLADYPDISFIDNYTLARLTEDMLGWFLQKRQEVTKETIVLGAADDRRLMLLAAAYYLYQGYQFIDFSGKMNLLKYSIGDYLDDLGANNHTERLGAAGATVTLRYSINNARSSAVGIPAGSRVTAGDGVYFATNEYAEIPVGSRYVDVAATCATPGAAGNGYAVGDLTYMTDIVPYIDSVSNITASEGGHDAESDDDYRERIYLSPDKYTDAGSRGGYEYWIRQFDPSLADVSVTSPTPRAVVVEALLAGGELPGQEYLTALEAYMRNNEVLKLTDVLTASAPDQEDYDVSVTYYINESDRSKAASIQTAVNAAIDDYIFWQGTKIGRDINPDELVRRIKDAGAKRVVLTSPVYTVVDPLDVAVCGTKTVTYGGLEDD